MSERAYMHTAHPCCPRPHSHTNAYLVGQKLTQSKRYRVARSTNVGGDKLYIYIIFQAERLKQFSSVHGYGTDVQYSTEH